MRDTMASVTKYAMIMLENMIKSWICQMACRLKNFSMVDAVKIFKLTYKKIKNNDSKPMSAKQLILGDINNLPFLNQYNFKELLFEVYKNGSKKNIELL